MIKKFISILAVLSMISVHTIAADIPILEVEYIPDENQTFTYAASDIVYVAEKAVTAGNVIVDATHEELSALPTWDGGSVTPMQDSTGTYLISTAAELAGFAALVNTEVNGEYPNTNINARLTRDINMLKKNGEKNYWNSHCIGVFASSVGSTVNPYTGTFDGCGHTIYNYSWNGGASNDKTARVRSYHIGLFAYIGEGAVLKNFSMVNADVCMASWLGKDCAASVVCGMVAGSSDNPALIENVYVSGNARSAQGTLYGVTYAYGSVAGIVKNAVVRNCRSDVEVKLTTESINGLANLRKEHFDLDSQSSTPYGIGGIVGIMRSDGTSCLDNCGNYGSITAPDYICVGGVAGTLSGTENAQNCFNIANVTGYRNVGGVFGMLSDDAVYSLNMYNRGNITAAARSQTFASGLVNHGAATKDRAGYSTGKVRIKSVETADGSGIYKYSENVEPVYNDTLALLFADDDSSVSIQARVVYPSGSSYMADNEPMWAISYGESSRVKASVGTGMDTDEVKSEQALSLLGEGFTADIGINDGFPILKSQYDCLVLDNDAYELAKYETTEKTLILKLSQPGYAALNVNLISDNAKICAYDNEGNLLDQRLLENDGYVSLCTKEETEVVIAIEGEGRAIVKTVENEIPVLNLTRTNIRVSVPDIDFDSVTLILALYNSEEKMTNVIYCHNVAVVDTIASAVINLNSEETEGCVLKVYTWRNGVLVPVRGILELQSAEEPTF